MMRSQPEPLNFKLARVTPKWAFKQSSRRALVLALMLSPFALLLAPLISSNNQPFAVALASLFLIGYIVILAWLIGATHAWADSPDKYLDEREIFVRNEVYLKSFRIIGALVSIGFLFFTVFPDAPVPARGVFGLLFPIVLFLPTCVLAWTQPDPL
jgi:hypothetical protein